MQELIEQLFEQHGRARFSLTKVDNNGCTLSAMPCSRRCMLHAWKRAQGARRCSSELAGPHCMHARAARLHTQPPVSRGVTTKYKIIQQQKHGRGRPAHGCSQMRGAGAAQPGASMQQGTAMEHVRARAAPATPAHPPEKL